MVSGMKSSVRTRGKPKGSPKTGGARKGSVTTQTAEVKAAVLRVFEDVNASDQYLRGIAETDPKLFLSLVARLIPVASEVTLDQRLTISIGSAMREAQARLESSGTATPPVIDYTPLTPAAEPEAAQ